VGNDPEKDRETNKQLPPGLVNILLSRAPQASEVPHLKKGKSEPARKGRKYLKDERTSTEGRLMEKEEKEREIASRGEKNHRKMGY